MADNNFFSGLARSENFKEYDKGGWDEDSNVWKPHPSEEGGRDTIAYGHKVTKTEMEDGTYDRWMENGITDAEAKEIFKQDYIKHENAVRQQFPNYDSYDDKYQKVLVSVAFNVGAEKTKKTYTNLLKAIEAKDDKAVYKEMLTNLIKDGVKTPLTEKRDLVWQGIMRDEGNDEKGIKEFYASLDKSTKPTIPTTSVAGTTNVTTDSAIEADIAGKDHKDLETLKKEKENLIAYQQQLAGVADGLKSTLGGVNLALKKNLFNMGFSKKAWGSNKSLAQTMIDNTYDAGLDSAAMLISGALMSYVKDPAGAQMMTDGQKGLSISRSKLQSLIASKDAILNPDKYDAATLASANQYMNSQIAYKGAESDNYSTQSLSALANNTTVLSEGLTPYFGKLFSQYGLNNNQPSSNSDTKLLYAFLGTTLKTRALYKDLNDDDKENLKDDKDELDALIKVLSKKLNLDITNLSEGDRARLTLNQLKST